MFKIITQISLAFSLALSIPLSAEAKIQQQGIKTSSDCTAAGATVANCLPLSSQIYDTTLSETISAAISNGDISLGSGSTSSNGLYNLGLKSSVTSNSLTITLTQKDGSTAPSTGVSSVGIPFRNSTAATGGWAQVSITSGISITIPSGTTIGTVSGVSSYIYVYALNNAGTVSLAVSLSKSFDEGSLQSTTAISTGSSATTLYSTSALTSLPTRLIGRLSVSETTAGTWATNASEISIYKFTYKPQVKNIFITSGTSWTSPADINSDTKFKFTLVGGGGGGGGAKGAWAGAPGGNSGAIGILYSSGLSPSTSYTIAIGARGSGGTTVPGNGSGGGDTSITIGGTTYTAHGGAGGLSASNTTAVNYVLPSSAIPGTSGNFTINGAGNAGTAGFCFSSGIPLGGSGGGSPIFGGSSGNTPLGTAGASGITYGAGGSGAASGSGTGFVGGDGYQGIILIEYTN